MPQIKFIDSVRDKGLKKYLNQTRDEHNGVGWAMFNVMMRVNTAPYAIHKIMNMTRQRVDDLITVYKEQYK
jgi:hypothetical protein